MNADLDRQGALYNVHRRRWRCFHESDRRYRLRILVMIESGLYVSTKAGIERSVKVFCTGLKRVEVSTVAPGSIVVKLKHKWWALPLLWVNRRRASAACSRAVAVGTCWEIK